MCPIFFSRSFQKIYFIVVPISQMENFYKIMQTIENGEELLSVVAASWEKDGKFMWPPAKSKILKTLMKSPMITPGTVAEGWTMHVGELKKSFIPTYSDVRKELAAMSDQSDTNSDGEILMPLPAKRRTAGARKIIPSSTNLDADRKNYNQVYIMH